jgi:MFS family permease
MTTTTSPPAPSALRSRTFRRLIVALAASEAGDWLYNLALVVVVFERTQSAGLAALTTAARVLPMVLVGPLGGVIADRFDRRLAMIASDAVRTLCMLGLAVVTLTGLPVLLLPLLAALNTAAGVAYPPCVAATVPRLVAPESVSSAYAARSTVSNSAIVAGPAFGALLVLLGSPAIAFLVNAGSFAVAGLLVWSIRAAEGTFRPARQGVRGSLGTDLRAGVGALRQHPAALRLAGADVLSSFVYGALTVLLLLLSRRLGFGDHGYGYLLAGMGAGGVLGAALAARAAGGPRRRTAAQVGVVVIGGTTALLAGAPWFPVAVAATLVLGVANIVVEVTADTTLQEMLPEEVFARAYGFVIPACCAAIATGSLAAPLLDRLLGLDGALVALALVTVSYTALLRRPTRVTRHRRAARLTVALTGEPVAETP